MHALLRCPTAYSFILPISQWSFVVLLKWTWCLSPLRLSLGICHWVLTIVATEMWQSHWCWCSCSPLMKSLTPITSSGFPVGSLLTLFLNVYLLLRDRERQSSSRGGTEREGDTESESSFRLWAVSTESIAGLELTDRDQDLSWSWMLNWLRHAGALIFL